MRRMTVTALNVNDKQLISLCATDIKRDFGLKGNAIIPVLKNIFGKHFVKGIGCYASKETLAKEVQISERQIYNILLVLKDRHLICGSPRNIKVTSDFCQWLGQHKTMMYWLRIWSHHRPVILKSLWITCGQSVDNLWQKVFKNEQYFISAPKILHTNNKISSYEDIINNSTSGEVSILDSSHERTIWDDLDLSERKRVSLEAIKNTTSGLRRILPGYVTEKGIEIEQKQNV